MNDAYFYSEFNVSAMQLLVEEFFTLYWLHNCVRCILIIYCVERQMELLQSVAFEDADSLVVKVMAMYDLLYTLWLKKTFPPLNSL